LQQNRELKKFSLFRMSTQKTEYVATVSNEEALLVDKPPNNGCAKCFMSVLSLIFLILGIAMTALASYTLVVMTYGGKNVLAGAGVGLASLYTLLTVGLVLIVLSVAVWISSCNPTACCSKFILTLFAIVMIIVFLVEAILVVFTTLWTLDINVSLYNYSTDMAFNETVHDVHTVCCDNVTQQTQDVCDHIFTSDAQLQTDCANYSVFYQLVATFAASFMKWIAVGLGVVAFLNLVAFVCSCCLLCARKRSEAYYKPAVTYQNGV